MDARTLQLVDTIATALVASIKTMITAALTGQSAAGVEQPLLGAPAAPAEHPNSASEVPVVLFASEVAGYLGRDTFNNRLKCLGRVWRRANEVQYQEVYTTWKTNGCTFPALHTAEAAAASAAIRRTFDPFPDVRTPQDVKAFREAVRDPGKIMELNRMKGHMNEEALIRQVEAHCGAAVVLRNTSAVWSSVTEAAATATSGRAPAIPRPPGVLTDPGPFLLKGEVDGWMMEDGVPSVVVEVKTRTQTVPATIPERDRLQVQTYLNMHRVQKAVYAQGLLGTDVLDVHIMPRDAVAWRDDILPALRTFVCDVRRLLRGDSSDNVLRHQTLQACDVAPLPIRQAPPAPAPAVHPSPEPPLPAFLLPDPPKLTRQFAVPPTNLLLLRSRLGGARTGVTGMSSPQTPLSVASAPPGVRRESGPACTTTSSGIGAESSGDDTRKDPTFSSGSSRDTDTDDGSDDDDDDTQVDVAKLLASWVRHRPAAAADPLAPAPRGAARTARTVRHSAPQRTKPVDAAGWMRGSAKKRRREVVTDRPKRSTRAPARFQEG